MVKKYILRIYYNTVTDEIVELSEQFSDCDEYRLVVNNKELEVPEEMKKYLNDMLNDDIAVS